MATRDMEEGMQGSSADESVRTDATFYGIDQGRAYPEPGFGFYPTIYSAGHDESSAIDPSWNEGSSSSAADPRCTGWVGTEGSSGDVGAHSPEVDGHSSAVSFGSVQSSGGDESGRAVESTTKGVAHPVRLPPWVASEIMLMVHAGKTDAEIADTLRMRHSTVTRVRRMNGVRLCAGRRGIAFGSLEIDEMQIKYRLGTSVAVLANMNRVSQSTIRKVLKANGVKLQRRGRGASYNTAQMVELHNKGYNISEIARFMGCTWITVKRGLRRAGMMRYAVASSEAISELRRGQPKPIYRGSLMLATDEELENAKQNSLYQKIYER